MCNSIKRSKKVLFFLVVVIQGLLFSVEAAAQQGNDNEIRCATVSTIGGRSNGAVFRLVAVGGQAHPTERSNGSNFTLLPGFIPCRGGPPNPPSNMVLEVVSSTQIDITWQDNSDNEDGFVIFRDGDDNSSTMDTVGVDVEFFSDTTVKPEVTYTYFIQAFNGDGVGNGDPDSATTLKTPDPCMAEVLSRDSIKLTWTDLSKKELGYKIERKAQNENAFQEVGDVGEGEGTLTFTDNSNIQAGNTYEYLIMAYNNDGRSDPCGTAPVTVGTPVTVIAEMVQNKDAVKGCPVSLKIFVELSDNETLLGSFDGQASWGANNLVLSYVGHSGLQSGFTGVLNDQTSGMMIFNGASASGASGRVELFTLDFETTGSLGDLTSLDLDFSSMAAAGTFADLLPFLQIDDSTVEVVGDENILGDANGDKLVNSTDALIVLSFAAKQALPPNLKDRIDSGVTDVNSDGVTNSTDALIILSFAAQFNVPFPIGQAFCP